MLVPVPTSCAKKQEQKPYPESLFMIVAVDETVPFIIRVRKWAINSIPRNIRNRGDRHSYLGVSIIDVMQCVYRSSQLHEIAEVPPV